jgi:hypothetical protein
MEQNTSRTFNDQMIIGYGLNILVKSMVFHHVLQQNVDCRRIQSIAIGMNYRFFH